VTSRGSCTCTPVRRRPQRASALVLDDRDAIGSTHRGHGHCIAKGVDIKAMMAEIYGKVTGSCRGKGGSMHIADLSKGMLGANGIVGGGPPLICGRALASKHKGDGGVAVAFFGDGASNQDTGEVANARRTWTASRVSGPRSPRAASSPPPSSTRSMLTSRVRCRSRS
jgi:TPP-dependent pyruvate/acetoin dehydrogenase alpha subunit